MHKMTKFKKGFLIIQDLILITISLLLAAIIANTGILIKFLSISKELTLLGTFVSGMFFTSMFTTAAAITALGEISLYNSIFVTAFVGAAGALVGDLLIFRFVKDKVSEHIMLLVKHNHPIKQIKFLLKSRYIKWITFLAGGLIIASPLPDELGIAMMGLSRTRTNIFVLYSFIFNFIGILIIGIVANAIF